MGKMLIVEFTEQEEQLYKQTVEWLSTKFKNTPTYLRKVQNGFSLNPYTRLCTLEGGNSIHLTAKEFDLLYFLFSNKGQVFTKEQLYEKVWGYNEIIDASNMTSFIRKLRLKVEPDPDNPQYIITV
ncbi:TPA: winged helix-turn-helix domain-containing protein [Clostridioides difficile]|nr:winged helix-turn-helix domain-containing protein [Clostridioides difficile]HBF3323562.1 winged helix-turn-helix domain-containing protein [Clostridioides difficile]HBF8628100.1 winged helix-turn-helix domain-containing protein [Clostridioides difficile]HBF9365348.1 winged helix-turn-helix domain-containing protein [Clostridioides difficile]HEK8902625.1 winged helix-turn-helix domain-containing protein [Clostridioides difficile]